MKVEDVKEHIREYIINEESPFEVKKEDLNLEGNYSYNKMIRNKITKGDYGVYLWSDTKTGEILYVGMSGKFKKDKDRQTIIQNHTVGKRLVSSRGRKKNEYGKLKDISTSDFIRNKVMIDGVKSITISVFYTEKRKYSPTYIESIILQNIFNKSNSLPKFNKSF